MNKTDVFGYLNVYLHILILIYDSVKMAVAYPPQYFYEKLTIKNQHFQQCFSKIVFKKFGIIYSIGTSVFFI